MEQMHEEVSAYGLGASIRLAGIEMARMRNHPTNLDSSGFDKELARLDFEISWRDLQPI